LETLNIFLTGRLKMVAKTSYLLGHDFKQSTHLHFSLKVAQFTVDILQKSDVKPFKTRFKRQFKPVFSDELVGNTGK